MIKVRPASEVDIVAACLMAKKVYEGERDVEEKALGNLRQGPTFCLADDGTHIGCVVGGIPIWDGVARVWAITTDHLDQHPVGYTRAVLALLKGCVRYYNIHRLEMTVKADYFAGIRWAKALGFEAEGLLRNYGPDKSDYLIFGRLT